MILRRKAKAILNHNAVFSATILVGLSAQRQLDMLQVSPLSLIVYEDRETFAVSSGVFEDVKKLAGTAGLRPTHVLFGAFDGHICVIQRRSTG